MQFAVAFKFCNVIVDGDIISFSLVDEFVDESCCDIFDHDVRTDSVDIIFVLLRVATDGSVWNDWCSIVTFSDLCFSWLFLGGSIGFRFCVCLDFFEDNNVAGFSEREIVFSFVNEGVNDVDLQDSIDEEGDRDSLEDFVECSSNKDFCTFEDNCCAELDFIDSADNIETFDDSLAGRSFLLRFFV